MNPSANYGFYTRFIITASLLLPLTVNASVVINGTRVIYPSSEKEVTIKLTNPGKSPVLIQNWVDKGDVNAKPDNIEVPFILLPPVNRLDPGKGQTLRLSYTGTPALPNDRESVYWLNVLEVPPMNDSKVNHLQMAFRSRVKIFYRPAALNDQTRVIEAFKKISWSVEGDELKANNHSPYFLSLASVTVKAGGKHSTIEGEMIPPMASKSFHMKDVSLVHSGAMVSWEFINDWGAVGTASVSIGQ